MGKKGSGKKAATATSGPRMSVTVREASTGKKHINAKSMLKLQHLKDLAVWASHDGAIPSLGAFFGHHLAAASEALAAPVDPSLFTCLRCESILHPGYNCTIRIEKNKTNTRRKEKGKKPACCSQNNIVYTCHFCSHRNMKRGTPRTTSLPKVKPHQKPTNRKTVEISETLEVKNDSADISLITSQLGSTTVDPMDKMGIVGINEPLEVKDDSANINTLTRGIKGLAEINETLVVKNENAVLSPTTPSTRPALTPLELKMKKKYRSRDKKNVASESTNESANAENTSMSKSNRRRRKSWTSLKEIAKRNENDNSKRLMNLTVPFSLK